MERHQHHKVSETVSKKTAAASENPQFIQAQKACRKLVDCANDKFKRTGRALDVVLGGMCDGAVAEAKKDFKDPNKLADHAWELSKEKLASAACTKLCPPAGIAKGTMDLWQFTQDTGPKLCNDAVILHTTFYKAFDCTNAHQLNNYKHDVAHKVGRHTLFVTTGAIAAAIGLGGGIKGGSIIKSRMHGFKQSEHAVRDLSGKKPAILPYEQFKKLYVDPLFHHKPAGSKIELDEYGSKRVYQANNAMDTHYKDGSSYHRNEHGRGFFLHQGERTREIPCVMRIIDKRNGDRVYKFHSTGEIHTHKPTGTVIKELRSGVVETHRTNGKIYREHPDGRAEILPLAQTDNNAYQKSMVHLLPSIESEMAANLKQLRHETSIGKKQGI